MNSDNSDGDRGHVPVLLITVLATFFIVCVAGFLLLAWLGDVKPNTLPFEAAKGLLQLAVVGVAGATLTLLSSDYQRRREIIDRRQEKDRVDAQRRLEKDREDAQRRLEFRQEQIKAVLAQTTASYNKVKRARRLLRVRRLVGHVHLAAHYDKHMEEIHDAQLEFETLETVVGAVASVFSDSATLIEQLKAIEKYLGKLITEQEEKRNKFTGEPEQQAEANLEGLQAFLEKTRQGGSFAVVSQAYRCATTLILNDLAELAEADS